MRHYRVWFAKARIDQNEIGTFRKGDQAFIIVVDARAVAQISTIRPSVVASSIVYRLSSLGSAYRVVPGILQFVVCRLGGSMTDDEVGPRLGAIS